MKALFRAFSLLSLLLFSSFSFANDIAITDSYVREVPPGIKTSASFLTLNNNSNKEVALIKATSDVASNVELHEHVHKDGMMEMRQVAKITIPANGERLLEPGGYHIMLIGLTRKIKAGDIIDISLEFDNGTKQSFKAEVKSIIDSLKKTKAEDPAVKAAAMAEIEKHVNPMPNYMGVYKKMGDQLNLSDEQKAQLDAGIKEREPKMKDLIAVVVKIEKDIHEAALNSGSIEAIDQLSNNLMQERLAIIETKNFCRESAKEIINEKQFQKMVELYRENMPKPKMMDEKQAEMAMIKHANPMPNLMMVVNKFSDKLNLTEQQAKDLQDWTDMRGPVEGRQYKSIMTFEKDIHELSLNNAPMEKLMPLADGIMQVRMKILRGKVLGRDNMRRILDDKQYDQVISLYKANFLTMKHKMNH